MNLTPELSTTAASLTLAGGCFWCLEAVFVRVYGVRAVQSGYANSRVPQPSYEAVCSGQTGAAEAIRVHYDPQQVSLDTLLAIFWQIHDPTTLNRQGADSGTQYRSGLYALDAAQLQAFEAARTQAQTAFAAPIVTEVVMLENFTAAEPEHHRYFERQPSQGYCRMVVAPKVHKLRDQFADLSSDEAQL